VVKPLPPEPKLIVSGKDAYWQEKELTEGGGNATVTVSDQEKQEWHGFGGTFNEAGWDALKALSEADQAKAIALLFDVTDGIGFTWGRIPIGASDYALDRYTLDDSNGNDFEMADFSIDRDKKALIPYIKAAQEIKDDITFWASPWTPPPWMKEADGTENDGFDKGVMKSDPQTQQAMADYFVKFVEAYEGQGIPIHSVAPQNEPGWSQNYPSCAWGPYGNDPEGPQGPKTPYLGTFVQDYLAPAMDPLGVKIWYGTLSNKTTFPDYWGNLSQKNLVIGTALQWECVEHVGTALQGGGLVMQSEHKCGNYPWKGNNGASTASSAEAADSETFWADAAPNNYNYAVESWGLIKQWIEAGVHIYSAWNMVLDTGGFNMDKVRPWPQNSLLVVDKGAKKLILTPTYYVFRHVAQYVEPGAKRLSVQGGNALAFKNPDGSIVTTIYNSNNQASQTTLAVGGTNVQFEIPGGGWATVNWQP
jgi:glucosylceramidase